MTDLSGQYLGRYYLSERLGEGGMAVVYKAYDTRLERDVAIKIIRSGAFAADAMGEVLKRFEREAKSLAKLSHPNIVKVYDYGENDGSPYLVMEYMPGGTLKKILGESIPWQDAVQLILPVARGVAYAHQRGILHRDIKPANVLITESGGPMLSDFGIAKLFEGNQTTALTGSGMAIGTPEYMAPEQWTGITNPQSDLYSLGIVLYEMVTGRKPYVADTPAAILIKQATEPLPSPRKFAVDLPEALELVLIKVLAKEPQDRYKDVNAFIGALESLHVSASEVPPAAYNGIEEKYNAPTQKLVVPVPTQILTQDDGATVNDMDAAESQKVEETLSSPASVARIPASIKFFRKGIGLWIGGVILVIAVWLGSSLIEKRFSYVPVITVPATTTITLTSQIIVPSKTIEPSQTPTEIYTLTVTPLPTEITDAKGVSMVLVPAGEFTMGSENGFSDQRPVHQVYLDAFYMDIYEVTNAFFQACVEAGGCTQPLATYSSNRSSYYGNSQYENYPVGFVEWNQAQAYCKWRGGGLPTEAQWEKAARGMDGRTYPWGEEISCNQANFWGKNNGGRFSGCVGDTIEVGSYENGKSRYGIYDMAGNIREWVADWYSETYYQDSSFANPLGPDSGQYRVQRGGAWDGGSNSVSTTYREYGSPDSNGITSVVGFRCAKDAIP